MDDRHENPSSEPSLANEVVLLRSENERLRSLLADMCIKEECLSKANRRAIEELKKAFEYNDALSAPRQVSENTGPRHQ